LSTVALMASNPAAPAATAPCGGDPRIAEPSYTKSTPWPGVRLNPSPGWVKGGPATLQVAPPLNPYTEDPQAPAKMPAAGIPTAELLSRRSASSKPSMFAVPPIHCPDPGPDIPENAGSNVIVPRHPPVKERMPVRLAWTNGTIGVKAVELNKGGPGLMDPLSVMAPWEIATAILVTRTWSTVPEAQKY